MANQELDEYLRRIVISGDITERTATNFLKQITLLEQVDPNKEIIIYIDTYGGNCDAAISMHDAMKICNCPIITIGIGKVMSAGVLLLASGNIGDRWITKNTRVMMHQISGGSYGTTRDVDVYAAEMKRQQDIFYGLIAEYSNQSKEKLLKDIMNDTYLSAEQALKYGLVDNIAAFRKDNSLAVSKPKPKKKVHKNFKKR